MNIAYRPQVPTWKRSLKNQELYEIVNKLRIEIQCDCIPGTLVYEIMAGYMTDFRSGPSVVNPFIPKIGDILLALAWLIHDVNYHGFLSKKLADRLLREMLEHAGMGTVKRNAVYYAVKFFAGSHYNTLDEDQGDIYNHNKTLVKMQWLDNKGFMLKRFNGRAITANAFR
ncbi:Protein of unknown function [Fibrobacter sp. UWR3]|uniref:DUF1353 domain-containing protein n=1 Tax=Fibrobacter sp. UWR3 TaxID=1896217 RepID=UPI0009184099|nr:DUF1353 domain-containing protein [Fibrobacter sp. UWR3]SHM20180.1 Protein of unknown function [Fibrobacter sp. UWR3]